MRNRVAIKKKSDVLWHAPVSIIAALAIYYLFTNLGNETGLGRDGSTLGCVLFWAITVCYMPVFFSAFEGLGNLIGYFSLHEIVWYAEKSAFEDPRAVSIHSKMKKQNTKFRIIEHLTAAVLFTVVVFFLPGALKRGEEQTVIWVYYFILFFITEVCWIKQKRKSIDRYMDILYEDCDPELFAKLMELSLVDVCSKRGMDECYAWQAISYYYVGDYERMMERLKHIRMGKLLNPIKIKLTLVRGNSSIRLGNATSFSFISGELFQIESTLMKLENKEDKFAAWIRRQWNLMIAVYGGNMDTGQFSEQELIETEHRLFRMECEYCLGKLRIMSGDVNTGKTLLETVTREAGTMLVRREAEEMLRQISIAD